MVNKSAVGLLAVVIVASLGVGVMVGMQLGANGGGDVTAAGGQSADGSTATPAGNGDGTTATTASGPSAEQRTTIPARQFDEEEIANYVAQFFNQEREGRGFEQLSTDGTTADQVAAMASDHSTAMANLGETTHEIDGVGTSGRYRNNDLFDRCKFKSPEGSYIRQPDSGFESIGLTYAGTQYEDDGQTKFNADERAVARAIVGDWMQSSNDRNRVLINGPTVLGVGVEVTDGGRVFVTANVCA